MNKLQPSAVSAAAASVAAIMRSCVFVEGTACVGKSSALIKLQKRVNNALSIYPGDFEIDVKRFPPYKGKHRFKYLNKMYPTYLLLKLEAHGIYDRTFLADFLYDIVFDIISKKESAIHTFGEDLAAGDDPPPPPPAECPLHNALGDNDGSELAKSFTRCALKFIEPLVLAHLRQLKVIVCIDEDVDTVLERMVSRRNGIDVLTSEYVNVQNAVFEQAANLLNWEVIKKEREEPMDDYTDRIAHALLNAYESLN